MAKKAKKGRGNPNKKNSLSVVFVAMILAIVVIGVAAVYLGRIGGGGDGVPSERTADGRLVVMEFSDYG